jgi:uncharacterized integral membrane protein
MSQSDRDVTTFQSKRQISPKLIIAVVLAVLVVIFVLQNADQANIEFLLWDFDIPVWIWMVLLLGIGFALGLAFPRLRDRRAARRRG